MALVERQLLIVELNLSAAKCLQAFGNLLILDFKLISTFVIESVEEKIEEVDKLLLI
jgi:hypothetical protein